MKWCRVLAGGQPSYGVVDGGEIALLDAAPFDDHRRTGVRVPLARRSSCRP